MAESSWPTVAGSRAVTDDQFELMSTHWSADGVDLNFTSTPVFGDSSGRQVKVRAGFDAIVGGHGYTSGTSDTVRAVTANASGSTRFDAVVLGLDRTTWAVTTYVKAGTPGAGTPPALTRNARGGSTGVWEIPLAMVQVTNGASTINSGDVTNIAWYVQGATVTTTSTNPLQPPAADYTRMRHTDTGHEFDSVAGAWRRAPWQVARGIIGGKRYTTNTTLAVITASEALAGMDTGSLTLEANRRYRFHLHMRLYSSGAGYLQARIRETSVAGTLIAQISQYQTAQGAHLDWHFVADLATSSAITRTYVATLSISNGATVNVNSGTVLATHGFSGFFVEDIGPALPNTVTNV